MSLTAIVCLLSLEAIFVNIWACNSKQDVCTTFVGSIMEIGACAFSQHNKENLLYYAATTQLTIDYLPKTI